MNGDYRGYAGKIESGRVRPGDEVVVLPRGSHAVVEAIDTPDGPLDLAVAGQSVVIRLGTDVDISRGDIIAATDAPPAPIRDLSATVCWLAERELTVGARVLIQHGTSITKAKVSSIDGVLDLDFESGTGAVLAADHLTCSQRHRPYPARPGFAAADRLLPRAPRDWSVHHRRRCGRLDTRRRPRRLNSPDRQDRGPPKV